MYEHNIMAKNPPGSCMRRSCLYWSYPKVSVNTGTGETLLIVLGFAEAFGKISHQRFNEIHPRLP